MARPRSKGTPTRVNILIDEDVWKKASARANGEYQFAGGFSEYVARLIVADLRRKRGIANKFPRLISQKEAAA
jgi:hypothetical protein